MPHLLQGLFVTALLYYILLYDTALLYQRNVNWRHSFWGSMTHRKESHVTLRCRCCPLLRDQEQSWMMSSTVAESDLTALLLLLAKMQWRSRSSQGRLLHLVQSQGYGLDKEEQKKDGVATTKQRARFSCNIIKGQGMRSYMHGVRYIVVSRFDYWIISLRGGFVETIDVCRHEPCSSPNLMENKCCCTTLLAMYLFVLLKYYSTLRRWRWSAIHLRGLRRAHIRCIEK